MYDNPQVRKKNSDKQSQVFSATFVTFMLYKITIHGETEYHNSLFTKSTQKCFGRM